MIRVFLVKYFQYRMQYDFVLLWHFMIKLAQKYFEESLCLKYLMIIAGQNKRRY